MFELSEEQEALKTAAADAASSILGPTLKEDDEAERFSKDLFR